MSRTFQLSGESHQSSGQFANRRVAALAVATIGILAALYLYIPRGGGSQFDQACLPLDQSAHETLAKLIAARTPESEARLGEAVFRLRRARNHCRNGWVTLAQQDYKALTDGRFVPRQ